MLPLMFSSMRAQQSEKYANVEISLIGKDMLELAKLGIETDHAYIIPDRSLTTILTDVELVQVQNLGFETKVLIADMRQHYLDQLNNPAAVNRDPNCTPSAASQWTTPVNYQYGPMGGYLTYDLMMAALDEMKVKFPDLISARQAVSDTIVTHEGRPLWYVKISDNADQEEGEPEVLYTALHHAREPNSASQMIFYMWYLLENYASDPMIKYLVDHEELHFLPCVNPDGYVYNETNDPQGGGLWRLNRRDNGDGSFGVDLNRNYGWEWGYDNNGSSPIPGSQTYRGPSGFSEPETRSLRDFQLAHDFVFTFNYHTRGNLLIYPWGYSDTPANQIFVEYAKLFSRENRYTTGTASQTVGYSVNGTSDDWMYGEAGSFSFTPEVGLSQNGFWPPEDLIDTYNKDNMWQNLTMAFSALQFGEAKASPPATITTFNYDIPVSVFRWGLQEGAFVVTLAPVTTNIQSVSGALNYSVAQFGTVSQNFSVNLSPSTQPGDKVVFLVQLNQGGWIKTDTVRSVFLGSASATLFQDDCTNTQAWIGTWMPTTTQFVSAPSSITDSPTGLYESNAYDVFSMDNLIEIPVNAKVPQLRFFARWDIEEDYDYVAVQTFGPDGNFIQLCGQYSELGTSTQIESEPIYDGKQSTWVQESMSLEELKGQTIQISFVLASDNFTERDGFYFDDVAITYVDSVSGTEVLIPLDRFSLKQNRPNPAGDFTTIQWRTLDNSPSEGRLMIYNALGILVAEEAIQLSHQSYRMDTRSLAPGVYTYLIKTTNGQSLPVKMTVLR